MKKAHYDTYDYPSYWKGRDYEHESEVLALKKLLNSFENLDSIADIGAGYGRLTPYYEHIAQKVYLVEPSRSLLEVAKDNFNKRKNSINLINSTIEMVDQNFPKESLDMVLMVRVMHHLKDPRSSIKTISSLLKQHGYLVLEFANKIHGKAIFKSICSGDFTFPIDITPTDRRCIENKKAKAIPFYNYHPDLIFEALEEANFDIVKKLSVSNVRNESLKRHIPFKTLLQLENMLQNSLSSIYFGPSIFVLAQKRG